MTGSNKIPAQFPEIIDLPVENGSNGAILITYGLVATGDVDNSQPPHAETYAILYLQTFIIGSAVLTLLWRMLFIRIFTAPLFMRRMLIVGAGRQGSELCTILRKVNPPPFFLAGLNLFTLVIIVLLSLILSRQIRVIDDARESRDQAASRSNRAR